MTININENKDYTRMAKQVSINRKAVAGSFFIKEDDSLLPHPSQVDTRSKAQKIRYQQYKAGAEFPEYPKTTLASLLGKMSIDKAVIKLPEKLRYLEDDSDGDRLSLKGLLESCGSNALQVKWHLLVADYKGLTDVPLESLSVKDVEEINPRATINQYSRESVKDWYFSRVNGRMQLVYLLLSECGSVLNTDTFERENKTSYLRLVLTEGGYYQQKVTEDERGELTEGDKLPVLVNDQPLMFIPYSIASDMEVPVGKMPLETGFLTPIIDLALFRYRVSADYKESLSSLQPMLNIYGVNQNDWKIFKEVNKRSYVAMGAKSPNVFPRADTKVELSEPSLTLEQFETFFERNDRDSRARGAVNNTEGTVQRSVVEIMTESSAGNAKLNPLANSIESAVREMVLYCGMFEGLYSQESISANMNDIEISLPRDFAISKLTAEEVGKLLEIAESGFISREEFIDLLNKGGWNLSEAEKIKREVLESPTVIDLDKEGSE